MDREKAIKEWEELKFLLPQYRDKDVGDLPTKLDLLYQDLKKQYNLEFPMMIRLVEACLIIPMTSCSCERMFSCQNRIKTKFRSRLLAAHLEALMSVSTAKIPLQDFDFDRAIARWVGLRPTGMEDQEE